MTDILIENDEFGYLEENSSKAREFVANANRETKAYFSKNSSYAAYAERINQNMNRNLLLIKSRAEKIYALKVLKDDSREIVAFDSNFQTWNTVIGADIVSKNELIENYDISNDGKYAVIIVKNLWSIFCRAYVYNLCEQRVISDFEQCNQGVFSADNKIYYQFNADESDFSQVTKVMCASINGNKVENISTLLEIDELNNMDIVVSNGGKYIFVNVLTDYYANDNIYFMTSKDIQMKSLLVEDKGRNLYIGSDDENHYFESNTVNENFSILALKIGDNDFSNAVEVVCASEYKHAIVTKRASFVNNGKILCVEQTKNGAVLRVANLKTSESEILECCGEGIYFGNMYHTSINESEMIYTTFENTVQNISVYKIDLKKMSVELIYGDCYNDEIETSIHNVSGKNLKVYRLRGAKPSRTILSFNSNPTSNLCGVVSNFNIKTPFREWILRGGVYAEYDFLPFSPENIDALISEVDNVIDFLCESKISSQNGIGLLQSDYFSSMALIYTAFKPEKVGAICIVNGRTDLLNYTKDTASYMFMPFLANPEVAEGRDILKKISPYEIAPTVAKKYPPQLLCVLDYFILVPSYHSKKLHAVLKSEGAKKVLLKCIENEDFAEITAEMLSFFESELCGGGVN